MKKLLFITSLCVCFTFVGACQSTTKNSKTKSKTTAAKNNDTKNGGTAVSEGSAGGGGIKKDSTKVNSKNQAVIHQAPNQAQIDSLKNAKTKSKSQK